MKNLALILAVMELIAKIYVGLDTYRLKQEGRSEANTEANAEQLARIQKALAARLAPDAFADGLQPDPDRRD